MKSTYVVKNAQNIYDVCVQIYGSIEGLFDLLISNDNLGFSGNLQPGTVLNYHTEYVLNSGIVEDIDDAGYVVANGEGYEYNNIDPSEILYIVILKNNSNDVPTIGLSGFGSVSVDWGSGKAVASQLSESSLVNSSPSVKENSYVIRIYGSGKVSKVKLDNADIEKCYVLEAKSPFEIIEDNPVSESTFITLKSSVGDIQISHGEEVDVVSSNPMFYIQSPANVDITKICMYGSAFGEQELFGTDLLTVTEYPDGSTRYSIFIATVSNFNKQIFRIKIS